MCICPPNVSIQYINKAPYIDVVIKRLSVASEGNRIKSVKVKGLLDTGSPSTLVCKSIIDRIEVKPSGGRLTVNGIIDKKKITVQHYRVELNLYNKTHELSVREWKKIELKEPYILIGRDILNNYSILFDGLKLIPHSSLQYHVWSQSV